MKKVLLVLFIVGSIFAYSSAKCEIEARKMIDFAVQLVEEREDIKVKYDYLGEHKGPPHLYLYQMSNDSKNMIVGIDLDKGDIHIVENYSKNSRQKLSLEPIVEGVEGLECK